MSDLSEPDIPITARTHRLTRQFAASTSVLIVAGLVLLSFRIVLRLRRATKLWIDDWLIIAGFVSKDKQHHHDASSQTSQLFTSTSWAVWFAAVIGLANSDVDSLSPQQFYELSHLAFFAFSFWPLAMSSVKCSILLTLLRLRDTQWWRILLHILIALQVVFGLTDSTYQWARSSLLDTYSCANNPADACQRIFTHLGYIESSFTISTDLIIAVLPATFLTQLQRPLWEKLLIALLTSLCLLACALSILKTITTQHFANPAENVADLDVALFTFACAELTVAILAACLFGLKASIFRALERLGFDVTAFVHRTYETPDELPDFQLTAASTLSEKEVYVPMQML